MGLTDIKYHHDRALNAPNSSHDNFNHMTHLTSDLKAIDPPAGEAATGNTNEKEYGPGQEHVLIGD